MDYRTATTAERAADFVIAATTLHKGRYDYRHVADQYVNGTTLVSIICSTHGVYRQKPQDHRRGQGCCKCSLHDGGNVELRTEAFFAKARESHGDRFDYSAVEFVGMRTNVTVICGQHGKFSVRPDNHTSQVSTGGCVGCSHVVTQEAKRRADGRWLKRTHAPRRRKSGAATGSVL